MSKNARSTTNRFSVSTSFRGFKKFAVTSSAERLSIPIAPCPTAGSISLVSIALAPISVTFSRFKPAIARKVPLATRFSSFFKRVCTFPRNSTTSRSGRKFKSCARLRKLEVPTRAPSGSSEIFCIFGETKASRTSSRGKYVSKTKPSG